MSDHKLTEAVKAGDVSRAKELLEAGADIHEQTEQEWTPLNWAAGRGDLSMVQMLVDQGADVFRTGRDLRTPYLIALAAGRVEVVKMLRDLESERGTPEQLGKSSQQEKQYCKAYYLKDLRAFPGWSESRINWTESDDARDEKSGDGEFTDESVVFIHQDHMVTESMWHNENVIYNDITPEWEEFCATKLDFKVPDDLDLIPAESAAASA